MTANLPHPRETLEMKDGRMTFGRYEGMAVSDLPVEYLGRLVEKMTNPPAYLLAELRRRVDIKETRDALVAQAALSNRMFARKRNRRPSQRDWWYAKADGSLSSASGRRRTPGRR